MGLVPFQENERDDEAFLSQPWEEIAKHGPSTSLAAGPHQTSDLPAPRT